MSIPPLATTIPQEHLTPGTIERLVQTWDKAVQEYRRQMGHHPPSEGHLLTAAIYLIHGIHQTNTVAAYEGILDGTGPAAPATHYLLSQPETIFTTYYAMMGSPWPHPLQARMKELRNTVQSAREVHAAHHEKETQ